MPVSQSWTQYTSAGGVEPLGWKPPGSLRSSIYTRKTIKVALAFLVQHSVPSLKVAIPEKIKALAGGGRGSGPQMRLSGLQSCFLPFLEKPPVLGMNAPVVGSQQPRHAQSSES